MSEIGNCKTAVVASHLGHDPVKSPDDEEFLRHASNMEGLAADYLMQDDDLDLEYAGLCPVCRDNRYGHHVEIDIDGIKIVGHLDRKCRNYNCPVEIKSLSRFKFPQFISEGFGAYPSYAYQECCYLETQHSPGLYVGINRDTGKLARFFVPYDGRVLNVPGFEKLELGITFDDVKARVRELASYIETGKIPDGEETKACNWCGFRYLCRKEIPEEVSVTTIDKISVIDAAEEYFQSKILKDLAESRMEEAKEVLLSEAREMYRVTGTRVGFKASKLSISYRGTRTKSYIDENALKTLAPDIYTTVRKESKPYDDYTIRSIK